MSSTAIKSGTKVRIKPTADTEADLGTVRGVSGDGPTALYEVDAIDATGRRSTLHLARSEFTLNRREARRV